MTFLSRREERAARDKPATGSAPIRLGESRGEQERSHWALALVVFMRALAVVWMAQGLSNWAAILTPSEPIFEAVGANVAAATAFFAVLDLVAAVGLWLATPWGGVLWLLSAIAQIGAGFAAPGFTPRFWIVGDVALIVVYFFLTWQAGRPRDADADAER